MLGGQNVFGSYLEKHHSKSESDNGSKEFGNKNEDANIHSKNPESEHGPERYSNHDNNGYYTESSDFIELGVDVVFQCQSIPHICGSWQLPLPITYSVCSCGKTLHRQPGKPDVNMDSVKTESEGEVLVHEDRNKTGKGNKQDPSKDDSNNEGEPEQKHGSQGADETKGYTNKDSSGGKDNEKRRDDREERQEKDQGDTHSENKENPDKERKDQENHGEKSRKPGDNESKERDDAKRKSKQQHGKSKKRCIGSNETGEILEDNEWKWLREQKEAERRRLLRLVKEYAEKGSTACWTETLQENGRDVQDVMDMIHLMRQSASTGTR